MIKGLKKSLILSCASAFLLPSVASADRYVTRFAGADRYETAIEVQESRKLFWQVIRQSGCTSTW